MDLKLSKGLGDMDIGKYTFQEFKDLAAEFHGFQAPGILIGGYMVELAKSYLPA
ncbi:MAG: hypothetical protein ACOC3Y_02740 [Desulfohalobiaceae bacterium]